jgi:hypothetical protein
LEPIGPSEARTDGRNPPIGASQAADYAFGFNPPYELCRHAKGRTSEHVLCDICRNLCLVPRAIACGLIRAGLFVDQAVIAEFALLNSRSSGLRLKSA